MFAQLNKLGHLAALFLLVGCSGAVPFETQILTYDGNKVAETFVFDGGSLQADAAGQWAVDVQKKKMDAVSTDYNVTFTMNDGALASGGAAVQFTFDNWSTENYIFSPCYLYGGNRFKILPLGYPPFIYDKEERPLDMPITCSNIPHFNKDGSDATVDFRTNNCATPLAGFYDKAAKKGFFILTEPYSSHSDNAFFISEYPSEGKLTIRLSSPGVREHRYTMCNADRPSDDEGIALKAGDAIKMHFRVYDFPCEDLMAYFDKFFTIRKDISGQNEYRNLEPFSSIHTTIYKHIFDDKWYESEELGYICNRPWMDSPFAHLQLGWNGVPNYSLMEVASPECQPDYEEVLRRVGRSFDSIKYMQYEETGLFNGMMKRGELIGDNFRESTKERDVVLLSRLGLTVYYSIQTFEMLRLQGRGDFIKPEWEEMIRKCCDGLCNLFDRYGEFGMFVYASTGEMHTPNSTVSAPCIGALAYASKYFDEPKYMEMAKKSGEYYYVNHLAKGYVGGGAAEIAQSPDAEATAELTDSYISIYELTREEKWLKYARDAAALFSSWVVSYDYEFPENSVFGKHNVKSAGSVWASVQNQHSAPGIYVRSGDSLLKLYRITGDERYIELCKDMAHNVVQYVNTEGNHIQPQGGFGYVTERVNISDWEGADGIGRIPENDTNLAWENVALFHTTENPGIYVQPDTGALTVFDHVTARIVSSDAGSVTLELTNPTYRDGDITVLCETSEHAKTAPLGWNAFYTWPKVHVPSGQTVTVILHPLS